MHWFSRQRAGDLLIFAFGLLLGVHLLILRGTIPYALVWGGLANERNIVSLSLVALGMTLFVLFVTASNLHYIQPLFPRLMRLCMWIICGYLCINTLANAWSTNHIEQYYLAPLTFVLAMCAGRVAWHRIP